MGGTSFSRDDYDAREDYRSSTGTTAFTYDADVRAGKANGVHDQMNPFGVKYRESRDSAEHPITIPIGISMDLTGSMSTVPKIFQKALAKLMGHFLEDKASGKRYLGEGYPAICIAGHDDYAAMGGVQGTVQVGQFESGLEIDDDLGRLWFTGNGGGGEPRESYELMLYFFARHTKTDHWEKRGRKGFLFLFGDEKAYAPVKAEQVRALFGDQIDKDIPIKDIVRECSERWHIFYVQPNMTSHWQEERILNFWRETINPEHVLLLDDPNKICELIVSTVALFEENADLADLTADGIATGLDKALVPLSRKVGDISKYDASGLPATTSNSGGTERL